MESPASSTFEASGRRIGPLEGSRASLLIALMTISAFFAILVAWILQSGADPPSAQLSVAARTVGNLLLVAGMSGVLGMATIEFWKVALRPRRSFQREELRRALGPEADRLLTLAGSSLSSVAIGRLEGPDPGPREMHDDLLDSPSEILMAQLGAAADYSMLRPRQRGTFGDRDYGFLRSLAGPAGARAVKAYRSAIEEANPPTEGVEDAMAGSRPTQQGPESPGEHPDIEEALYRVRFHVEQRLDALHIRLRDRWRRRVRLLAALASSGIGALTFVFFGGPVGLSGLLVAASIVAAAGVWGGFFSWFARDLVALAERHRR